VPTEDSRDVALVTGAGSASGIGFATAKVLAARGTRLVITSTTDRIRERAAELGALGAEVVAVAADLRQEAGAQDLVRQALESFGRIDICVNNAGMIQSGADVPEALLENYGLSDWDEAILRNLTTCYHVTRAVLPAMKSRRYGRIVNVSSTSGPVQAYAGDAGYHAAKAGMVGFTRATALETAGHGITVNAVAPGWIATGSQTSVEAEAGRRTPVGRSGTPEEVGAVIAFLGSREASYVTGQLVVVDGGNCLPER